jgi:hypothetical protein
VQFDHKSTPIGDKWHLKSFDSWIEKQDIRHLFTVFGCFSRFFRKFSDLGHRNFSCGNWQKRLDFLLKVLNPRDLKF